MNASYRNILSGIICLCFTLQCDKPVGSNNKGNQINISGKVIDKNGNPVSGVVVHIENSTLYDTTGSNGQYAITAAKATKPAGDTKDTLTFSKTGQIITNVELNSLVEQLPDMRIVQRNIYGNIDSISNPLVISSVQAVVSTAKDTISSPIVATLWLNTATLGYSGYVYFVYSTDSTMYNVYVNMYVDSVISGRSMTISFPDYAGDIQIPAFNPLNEMLMLSGPSDSATNIPLSPTLQWSSVRGALSYRLQVSSSSSAFSNNVIDDSNIALPQMTCNGLPANTSYCWRVASENGAGISPWTGAWSFTTIIAPPIPKSPANVAINQSLTPLFTWDTITGNPVDFQLQVSTDSLFTNPTVNDSNLNCCSKSAGPFSYNTSYYWRVQAYNTKESSGWSKSYQFSTKPTIPATPVLSAPSNGATIITNTILQWSSVGGALTYRLQVSSSSPAFSNNVIADSNIVMPQITCNGFSANTSYCWRVASENGGGISPWSSVWSFTALDIFDSIGFFLTPADVDTLLKLGMIINAGANPPYIVGDYYVANPTLTNSNIPYDNVGESFTPWSQEFYNQTADLHISEQYVEGGETAQGIGVIISGSGNNFTVYVPETGTETNGTDSVPFKSVALFSGTLTASGIYNYQEGLILTWKGPDPDSIVIRPGQSRVIGDTLAAAVSSYPYTGSGAAIAKSLKLNTISSFMRRRK